MKINVYLPDELGQRAKDAGLNLSALLRAEVINELNRMEAMENLKDNMNEYEIPVEDDDGSYVVKLVGTPVDEDSSLYLTEDERLFWYDEDGLQLYEVTDLEDEDMGQYFKSTSDYVQAMTRLGRQAVVSL